MHETWIERKVLDKRGSNFLKVLIGRWIVGVLDALIQIRNMRVGVLCQLCPVHVER